MKRKIRPITVLFTLYAGGGLVGLALALAGIELKHRSLSKAGMIVYFCGIAIGCIPLIGTCCYLLWKKMRSVFSSEISSSN
jgi:hypothetical protein